MSQNYSSVFRPESVLLTGGRGFIGTHVNKLLDYRCSIASRVFDAKLRNSRQVFISDLITSQNSSILSETRVIIHLANLAHAACYSDSELQSVNVDLTLNLARNAARHNVKRFVYVSSIVVNGRNTLDSPFSSASIASPNSTYAKSKLDAEIGLKKIAEETGLEVVIVRPTLVYGPNAPRNFGSLVRLVNKSPILPFGLVKNKRDFIAVQNLADLLVVCAKHPEAVSKIFLASDGEAISIKDFSSSIARGLGKMVFQLPIPVGLMRFTARIFGKLSMAEQLFGNLEVDSSDAQKILEWRPPFTMEQAMQSLKVNK